MERVYYPNLEAELLRAGISKSDLAAFIGISVSALYAKMNGSRPFKLNEAIKITKYISIATEREYFVEYLFKLEPDPVFMAD